MDTKNGEVDSVIIITPSAASFDGRHAVLLAEYLERLRALQRSPKTIRNSRWAIGKWFAWLGENGGRRVQDTTAGDVEGFMVQQRELLAEATQECLATGLRPFFRYLEGRGLSGSLSREKRKGEVPAVEIGAPPAASFAGRHGTLEAEYLERLRVRQCSPKTIVHHRWAIEKLFAWLDARGHARVQDTTREDLTRFMAQQRECLAEVTLEGQATILRQFFRYLEQTQRLFVNPMAKWIIRRTLTRIKPVPDEEEVRRLLAAPDVTMPLGIRDRAILETAYSTGARLGELAGMKTRDLELAKGLMRVRGKGRQERVVPLGRQAVAWLARYAQSARPALRRRRRNERADETAWWLSQDGDPLSLMSMELIFLRQSRAAGLRPPVLPQAVRRACVTHMLRHGAHPVQLQQLLGHATLDTLRHYLRVNADDLRRMHAQSKMGR